MIARGKEGNVVADVANMAVHDPDPIYRARALWVWHAIEGDSVAMTALSAAVSQGDPRMREQAIRILGRDCRENGRVEYKNPDAKQPPAALKHLEVLVAMADDPDAGVRRELILALRNLPTDESRRCSPQAGRGVGWARPLVLGGARAGARKTRE